jgi:hypothetical protein
MTQAEGVAPGDVNQWSLQDDFLHARRFADWARDWRGVVKPSYDLKDFAALGF